MDQFPNGREMRKELLVFVVSTTVALISVELILVALDFKPYYSGDPAIDNPIPAPFWISDDDGMRFDKSRLMNATGRLGVVNGQGYGDTDEFIYTERLDEAYRVLVLGDSFTWGSSAGLGHSYVDVLEAGLQEHHDAVVWNAGIPATGTKQAVRSLRKLSPLLKPHLVILGFYRNDFNDNMYPLDMYIRRRDFKAIHMYTLDEEFNPVRLGQPVGQGAFGAGRQAGESA